MTVNYNVCGTCKFSKYDRDINDYVCDNDNSENYGLPIAYEDRCEDQEEREQ